MSEPTFGPARSPIPPPIPSSSTPPDEPTFVLRLGVITAVGAAIRLVSWATKIGHDLLLNDSIYYRIQAGRNADGDWFKEALTSSPGAEHGPLTSLYLTPFAWLADNVSFLRLAITALGIATVAMIGLLGRRLAGDRVGLVAAAIAAAYPNLWVNDALLMSETLCLLLVTTVLYVAVGVGRAPRWSTAAGLGALIGLSALTRAETVLLIPLVAAVAGTLGSPEDRGDGRAGAPSRWAVAAVIVAAAVAVIAPWSLWNVARFREPVLLTTNDGNTLLGSYCDRTFYGSQTGSWEITCIPPLPEADLAAGRTDASVWSKERRQAALDYAGDHLGRLPVVVAARLGRALDLYGFDSLVAQDVGEEKPRPVVWAGIVAWWVLATLAVVGWRAAPRPERRWLVPPVAAVAVTVVVFYGAHRIRAPMEPVVVVLAAVGLVHLAARFGLPARWPTGLRSGNGAGRDLPSAP